MRLQAQVKKDFCFISVGVAITAVVMLAAFALLHFFVTEKVPFDYTVVLGGVFGALAAIGLFFDLAVSVQRTAAAEDPKRGELIFRNSYTRRMLLHALWVVLAVKLPCFHWAAAFLPLLFPRLVILLTRRKDALDKGKEEPH